MAGGGGSAGRVRASEVQQLLRRPANPDLVLDQEGDEPRAGFRLEYAASAADRTRPGQLVGPGDRRAAELRWATRWPYVTQYRRIRSAEPRVSVETRRNARLGANRSTVRPWPIVLADIASPTDPGRARALVADGGRSRWNG